MKLPIAVLFLSAMLFLSGCSTPGGTGPSAPSRPVVLVEPRPDGYFTGREPGFETAFNPDPAGRKFRVAYLHVVPVARVDGKSDRKLVEVAMADVGIDAWMGLREQASGSDAARVFRGDSTVESASRSFVRSLRNSDRLLFSTDLVPDADAAHFAQASGDVAALNAKLAARCPELFSTDPAAFPLDVLMATVYSIADAHPAKSVHEAWLVGLPRHANPGPAQPGDVFKAEEAYRDPLDAIAAALFKLDAAQFSGLVRPSPLDHDWLEVP